MGKQKRKSGAVTADADAKAKTTDVRYNNKKAAPTAIARLLGQRSLTPMQIWRIGFYLTMAANWYFSLHHGPYPEKDPLLRAMTYNHAEWVYDMAPKTEGSASSLRTAGAIVAIASIFNDSAALVFALLAGSYLFTSVTCFVNHDYLFFLLSTLMAFYCHSASSSVSDSKSEHLKWIHALRGQIVVVYAFASLWKITPDWLDGTICKGIFLSFEEQNVSRGVSWSKIYAAFPQVFCFVAISGLLLDFMLFLALMFLPPGHMAQFAAVVFHGFTGVTLAQRIGYAFPLGMILASFLFQPIDDIDDTESHYHWLKRQVRLLFGKGTSDDQGRKLHLFPLIWLAVQWILPLRMPLISRGLFKFTMEGYRWSWTMMLHSKTNFHQAGMSFLTLRPKCGSEYFPNMMAAQNPYLDPQSYPYEQLLGGRSLQVAMIFPRQMPKIANALLHWVKPMCKNDRPMTITTSYFSSVNGGPFRRIISPDVDLTEVHRSHRSLSWLTKVWLALIDKAPPGQEFILRGIGSGDSLLHLPGKLADDAVLFFDRSACLQADPIRVHNTNFQILLLESKYPLLMRACDDLKLGSCKEVKLYKGTPLDVPAIRSLSITLWKQGATESCSESTVEDVAFMLRPMPTAKA